MNNFKEIKSTLVNKFYENLVSGINRSNDLIQEMVGVRNRIIRAFTGLKYLIYSVYISVLGTFVKVSDALYNQYKSFVDLFTEYGRKVIDTFSFGNSNIADIVWVVYVLVVGVVVLTLVYYLLKLVIKFISSLRLVVNELNSMKNELLLLVNKNIEVKNPMSSGVQDVKNKNINGEESAIRKYSDAEHIAHLRRK